MSGSRLSKILKFQPWRFAASTATSTSVLQQSQPLLAFQATSFHHAPLICELRPKKNAPATSPFCQRRCIEIDTHGQAGEELSERDYHRLADLTLGEVMVKLESLIEETTGIADSDLEYSQGVLTLNLGAHGTYVINKQAPNKQIWMSSPISGPVRYDLVDGRWIYKHDGHTFQGRLADELQSITGDSVDLDQEPQVAKGFVGYGADPT